jgi:hypothetical protein
VRFYAVKDGAEKFGYCEGGGEADRQRQEGEFEAAAKEKALDAGGLGTESHANADFIDAEADAVVHYAVEADSRE